MALTAKAVSILDQIPRDKPKMGDLKKIAKEVKRDHDTAMDLWATGEYYPRLIAVLIMDKKLLTQELMDRLAADLEGHTEDERTQIVDWLLANQLNKDKNTIALINSWEHAESPVLRRIFWYHQGRLRWSTKAVHDNASALLDSLESDMENAEPEVQWAMNFTAGQIGVFEPEYRDRCIKLGERLGLYKDDPVPRGCTSPYIPRWIETEVAKRA